MDETAAGIRVGMRFDYIPKFNPPLLGWLMNWLLGRTASKLTAAIFDGWQAAVAEHMGTHQAINTHEPHAVL